MKNLIQKIMSSLMAFVVLFSAMSFTIDVHYCGDALIDIAIFHKAKTCGMETQEVDSNSGCSITKENCCSNVQLVVDGQDELQLTSGKLTLERQTFVASFVSAYTNFFEYLAENTIPFSGYSPPLIIRNLHGLYEVFLI